MSGLNNLKIIPTMANHSTSLEETETQYLNRIQGSSSHSLNRGCHTMGTTDTQLVQMDTMCQNTSIMSRKPNRLMSHGRSSSMKNDIEDMVQCPKPVEKDMINVETAMYYDKENTLYNIPPIRLELDPYLSYHNKDKVEQRQKLENSRSKSTQKSKSRSRSKSRSKSKKRRSPTNSKISTIKNIIDARYKKPQTQTIDLHTNLYPLRYSTFTSKNVHI